MGFVGFFGIVFLVVTVACECAGRPALGWALTLLACVLVVVTLDRWRLRVLRRTEDAEAEAAGRPVRRDRHPVGVHVPGGHAPVATVFGDHVHAGWDDPTPRRPRVVATTGVTQGSTHGRDVTRGADG